VASSFLALAVRAAVAALLWSETGTATLFVVEVAAALAAGLLAIGAGAALRALVVWLAAALPTS
jgi:hypothetical protein